MNGFLFCKGIKGSAFFKFFQDIVRFFLCLDQDSFNLYTQRCLEFFRMGLIIISNIFIAYLEFFINKFFLKGTSQNFRCSIFQFIGNFRVLFKAGFCCFSGENSCLYEIINPSLLDLFFFLIRSLGKKRSKDFFFKSIIPNLEEYTLLIRFFIYLCIFVILLNEFLVFLPEQFIFDICLCLFKGHLPFIALCQDLDDLIPLACLYYATELFFLQGKGCLLEFRIHLPLIKPAKTSLVFV